MGVSLPLSRKMVSLSLKAFTLLTAIFLGFTLTTQTTNISFDHLEFAAQDFGDMVHNLPMAVVYPKSVDDVSFIIYRLYEKAKLGSKPVHIAARGNGHSTQGQAQAGGGVVINMQTLQVPGMYFNTGKNPFVDVSAGELWINVLNESLKHGLTPKSWTDYLYLTVGGTLSNGGISGQTFRNGPQIDNVQQLEIVTGKGEIKNCSDESDYVLFYGALGGLGQFGVITRARISLEPAPSRVKVIRAFYSKFSSFSRDQEYLISSQDTFDYIEGFVIINSTGLSDLINYWGSSFKPEDIQTNLPNLDGNKLEGNIQFCLEVAKYFNPNETDIIDQKINKLLSGLSYIQSTLSISDVSYVEFLDRVHTSELELRKKGLWEVPHPWLNLLVPKSSIEIFVEVIFANIVTKTVNGPILIYPVNKTRWNYRTALVTPEEDIIYLVAFLSAAVPSSNGTVELERLLAQNKDILDFCVEADLGVKEYLPHYTTHDEWKAHFESRWGDFVRNKRIHDPLALLAPGQQIFPNGTAF